LIFLIQDFTVSPLLADVVMGKVEQDCCGKYRKKGKACKKCPLFRGLSKKKRKKLLSEYA